MYKSAKLPTYYLPTGGGSGKNLGNFFRLQPENNFLGNSEGADCTKHWRDTSILGFQPSRGRVPFVPWKRPVCQADTLSNLYGFTQ